jgi:hypothetical protein
VKALLLINLLWSGLLAFAFSPDKDSDAFDIALSVACYVLVVCAFGMFFRARWAWRDSLALLFAIAAFFSRGIVRALLEVASGRSLGNVKGWLGWGVMLGVFLPTTGLIIAVALSRRCYGSKHPRTTA